MLTTEAVEYFGSKPAVAKALGLHKQAVYAWKRLVPPLSAARIERLTNGALKFDPSRYDPHRRVITTSHNAT